MKNLINTFTPEDIAENQYMQISYNALARAVRLGDSIKDVEYVDQDLKAKFIAMGRETSLEFIKEVRLANERFEIRERIKSLRNAISNKEIAIKQLENKLNK